MTRETPSGSPSRKKGPAIDDGLFVEWYKVKHELYCINSVFYDEQGHVPDDSIKSDIQNLVKGPYVPSRPYQPAKAMPCLFDSLKNECFFQPPPLQHDIVNLHNKALKVDETAIL